MTHHGPYLRELRSPLGKVLEWLFAPNLEVCIHTSPKVHSRKIFWFSLDQNSVGVNTPLAYVFLRIEIRIDSVHLMGTFPESKATVTS